MKAQSFAGSLILAAMLALTAPSLRAQDGLEGALRRVNFAPSFGPTLAIADFDRDKKADGAVLVDSGLPRGQCGFQIEIHFSGRENVAFTFQSTEAVHSVSAWDIDRDGDTDVIVEQPFTEQRLQIWLNDGRGNFQSGRIEDFPSPPTREHLTTSPGARRDVCIALPPQRCFETDALPVRRLLDRPVASSSFPIALEASLPALYAFSANSSRAPPYSPSH